MVTELNNLKAKVEYLKLAYTWRMCVGRGGRTPQTMIINNAIIKDLYAETNTF